jgi:hypothetical protein
MRHEIPPKIGKVRVAVTLGNKYAVWNGKNGKAEFRILCKDRREATQIAAKINQLKQKDGGVIEVD